MALTGLAAMKQRKKEREEAANRPKANWFSPTAEGVKVRFLQELDDASPNYNADNGLGIIAVERVSPYDFKRRAVCTLETEGKCYPQEWHEEGQRTKLDKNGDEYKGGWRQQTNFYISVLAERDGKTQVEILRRNFNNSFVDDLMEIAEEDGTITEQTFIVKKRGSGTQTTWTLKPSRDGELEVGDAKPYNLEEVALRHVPYDQQPAFFDMLPNGNVPTKTVSEVSSEKKTEEDEW